MFVQHNVSLKTYNSFGIDVKAKKYIAISSVSELKKILPLEKNVFVLSGGSNLLLTKDIEELVIHLKLKGKKIDIVSKTEVLVRAQAGEDWHNFVLWCIENDFGGLENLALIPGNVGTSPIQNIGAYGVEVKDRITEVETIEIKTGKIRSFSNKECKFSYRNSIFKNELKEKYIILSVQFKLSTVKHDLNYSYRALQSELINHKKPTIKDICKAVIAIRNRKLPDPKIIGNSGSFFKNPVISKSQFLEIQKKHKDMPHYTISKTEIKVPAAWLIEQCGFKGKRYGETGSHKDQALVLVNYGKATGKEVYELAKQIQKTVLERFSISLEVEVNIK